MARRSLDGSAVPASSCDVLFLLTMYARKRCSRTSIHLFQLDSRWSMTENSDPATFAAASIACHVCQDDTVIGDVDGGWWFYREPNWL